MKVAQKPARARRAYLTGGRQEAPARDGHTMNAQQAYELIVQAAEMAEIDLRNAGKTKSADNLRAAMYLLAIERAAGIHAVNAARAFVQAMRDAP